MTAQEKEKKGKRARDGVGGRTAGTREGGVEWTGRAGSGSGRTEGGHAGRKNTGPLGGDVPGYGT